MASTTSFVNVLPTPDDPIRTVGLIAWKNMVSQYENKKLYKIYAFELN